MKTTLENEVASEEQLLEIIQKRSEENYLRLVVRRFFKHKLATVGLIVMVLITFCAIFASVISPYDPYVLTGFFSTPPSPQYLLGTDPIGRDVLSRLIYASRISLMVGLGTVSISIFIGTILGLVAGYFGGLVDMLVTRITDMFMSFPSLMLILVVVSLVGPSIVNIVLILGLLGWPPVTRLVRGCVLSLKPLDYVKAGVALGLGTPRIMFLHILPNVIAPILVNATFGIAIAIITEASLSFLGMGVQPPTASWGNMLTDAQSLTVLVSQQWLWAPPGIMIFISVLSINFIGDGLRDALDPKNIK